MKHTLKHCGLLAMAALVIASCGGAPATTQDAGASATAAPAAAETAPTAAGETAPTAAAAEAAPTAAIAAPAFNGPTDADPRDGLIKPEPIPEGMFPLTQEKVTIRIAAPSSSQVEDITTNEFTKWYEEQTNVHIDWVLLPSNGDEALQKLNLMLSSGDIPEVIMGFGNLTPALQQLYGQQGIFIPLNSLIDQYGTNVKNAFAQYPLALDVITAPDGNIYSLPEVNDCYHCSVAQKLWVYTPWLDKLGMQVPTTTDEFYAMLKAFKEQDPNGNGQADEVPLSSDKDGWNSRYDLYFMNSFLLNSADHMMVKDGKVTASYNQPEWREGLRYLQKLYQDGLMDPNSLTQDNAGLMRIGQSDPPILGSAPWGYPGGWAPIVEEEGARWTQYQVIPPLKGPEGFQVQPSNPYSPFTSGRFIITSAAKDPALAFRWADGFFQQEVELNAYYGLKDVGWRWAKDGEIGINGEPALYAQLKTWGNVQNDHWSQVNVSFRSSDWRLGMASDTPYGLETVLYNESKKLDPLKQDPSTALPPLFFAQEAAQEVAQTSATLTQFVNEMTARFITGDASIDNEWDSYVQTLDQQGLPRLLELYQAAYDAKAK